MPQQVTLATDNLPSVALVGRVNVGKSSLFNRLIEKGQAIVSDTPGTTRTSNEGLVLWRGKQFRLIDTGGLTFTDDILFEEDILRQSEVAMKKADIIVFVTDAQDGVLPQEQELAKRLRKMTHKPVVFIANKVDTPKEEPLLEQPEWYKLGMGQPFPVSATTGYNLGDFLDELFRIFHSLPIRPKRYKEEIPRIRVALMGKPNVGKSSLFNKLVGQEEVIVSDMEHTTREPHDTDVTYEQKVGGKTIKHEFTFVDTAGIRRKSKVKGDLERSGIGKSIKTLDDTDVVLFVLDATKPFSHQDKQLGGLLEQHAKSVIILLNKWDTAVDKSDTNRNLVKQMVYGNFPHLRYAPILFTSGLTGYRVHDVFPSLVHAVQAAKTTIGVKALEKFLEVAMRKHLPSKGKGTRQPKIMGIKQIAIEPPVFELVVKYRTSLHSSYVHFIENRMREQFDFYAAPLVLRLKKQQRR